MTLTPLSDVSSSVRRFLSTSDDPAVVIAVQQDRSDPRFTGLVVAVNEPWSALVGYSAKEVVGQPASFYIHPDEVGPARDERVRGGAGVFTRKVITKDGTVRAVAATAHPLGAGEQYLIVYRGIVERARIGPLFAALEQTVETGRFGNLWSHAKSDFALVTPGYFQLTGIGSGPADAVAAAFMERVHPEDRDSLRAAISEASDSPARELERDIRLNSPDGEKTLSIRSRTWYDAEGHAAGSSVLLQDVSDWANARRALRESEEGYRTLVEGSQSGMLVFAGDGEIVFCNQTLCDMLGATCEQLLQVESVLLVIHPDDRESVVASWRSMRQGTDAAARLTCRLLRIDDGQTVTVTGSITPYAGPGEGGYLAEFRDVTAEFEAERALRASEERLRAIVETARSGIMISDASGQILFANPAAVQMYGYERDEMIGLNAQIIVLEDEREANAGRRAARLRGEPVPRSYRMRRLRKDGRVIHVDVSVSTVRIPGQPDGVLGETRDVTEQVRAEEALRASEERLRAIVDTARSGILIRGEHGAIRFANRACEEMFGYGPGELSGLNADVLIPESDRDRTAARRAARLAGEAAPSHYREKRLRKDGSAIYVDYAASVVSVPGEPDGVLVEMRDVTEAVKLQEQLLQAQKSEALGTLVAGVAHDFNNLLTPVLGGIEFARLRPDEAERWLVYAKTAAERAAELVQQLLAFSRPSERRREPVDATAAVSEAVSMARETFDRRIQLHLEAAEELPPVLGDHGELCQVLMNLVLNARDAVTERLEAGGDGRYDPMIGVTVDATPGDGDSRGHVRIIVQDNGAGMSEEVRERAFDPFFSTKEAGEGTGLGLATAYRIIDDHDGSLELDSTPGVGTTFTIRLPVASREAPNGDSGGESAEPTWIGSEHSVLVLDDDPMIVELADAALTGAGCDVVATTSVSDALRAAEEQTFDLLVLDLNMPEMSGWQALERFREIDPELPVLIATGFGSEAEARERGARGLLPKPYTPGQLVAVVTTLVLRLPGR